jgi:CBS domain-containing protein
MRSPLTPRRKVLMPHLYIANPATASTFPPLTFSIAGEEDPGAAQDDAAQARDGAIAAPTAARSGTPARVSDISAVARSRLITVAPDTLLVEVAAGLSSAQLSVVVVCSAGGRALGVSTETLLVRQLGLGKADLFNTRAVDVMSTAFHSCAPDEDLAELMDSMHDQGLVHVLVLDARRVVQGIVHPRDGLRALLAAGHEEEALLRQYVMGEGYQ